MELIPAERYSFEQLTDIYNQTRVDYLVPMPMNVAKIKEYVHVYDADLFHSCVAVEDDEILGLGMVGMRQNRGWITRLGVIPNTRRKGTGRGIMEYMIDQLVQMNSYSIWLEVIKGNTPAHQLFLRLGFVETRELIVARRPPNANTPPNVPEVKRITALDHEEAIILLSHRQERPNWLNETESMQNTRNLSALLVELTNGGRGWVTYHASLLQLTRIVVEVTAGDPIEVTAAILNVLHQRYKRQDAKTENIPDDIMWLGFQKAGYFDSFRRIEMVKPIK